MQGEDKYYRVYATLLITDRLFDRSLLPLVHQALWIFQRLGMARSEYSVGIVNVFLTLVVEVLLVERPEREIANFVVKPLCKLDPRRLAPFLSERLSPYSSPFVRAGASFVLFGSISSLPPGYGPA
jgi:hypothetical protein